MSAEVETQGSWFTGLLSVATSTILVVAVALALALAVVPRVLGGGALTVMSGSMEPAISAGDMIVIRPVTVDDVEVGDVVTFQPISDDPTLITHRVVGKQMASVQEKLVTRGDANGTDDSPILPEQIKGELVYSIPNVGHLSLWAGSHRGVLVTVTGVGLLAYAVVMILRPTRRASVQTSRPDEAQNPPNDRDPVEQGVTP